MLSLWLLGKMALSIVLWILLGMEREQTYKKYEKVTFVGVRTFGLIALLWFMSAMLAQEFADFWMIGVVFIVIALFVILSSYVSQKENKSFGLTTEIGALICFLLWVLVFFDYELIAIAIAIVTFALFSFREQLHSIVHTISSEEIYDAVKFAIIVFIVLPLLPDQDYGFLGLFNPYKTRLMVVFVFATLLPQIANQVGWFAAEMGRQPWVVYGLLRTSDALSKSVQASQVLFSLILFMAIYLLLFLLFIYMIDKKIKKGPYDESNEDDRPLQEEISNVITGWNYANFSWTWLSNMVVFSC